MENKEANYNIDMSECKYRFKVLGSEEYGFAMLKVKKVVA